MIKVGRAIAAAIWVTILLAVGYLFWNVLKPDGDPTPASSEQPAAEDRGVQVEDVQKSVTVVDGGDQGRSVGQRP